MRDKEAKDHVQQPARKPSCGGEGSHCPPMPGEAAPGHPRWAPAVIIMPGGTRIELQDQPASYVVECVTLVDALRGPTAFSPQGSRGL